MDTDPVLSSFLNAPPDDEPHLEEEQRNDAEGSAAIADGKGIWHEVILRDLGL